MFARKRLLSPDKMKLTSIVANTLLILLNIILLFSFWNIQIIKTHQYRSLAKKNIYGEIETKAPRGIILDRNDIILAENKLDFGLFLFRKRITNQGLTIANAMATTGLKRQHIENTIEKYSTLYDPERVPLKRNLPLKNVIFMQSRADEFPEFEIDVEPTRAYPFGNLASHVLGYVSEISADELNHSMNQNYRLGDVIGKAGIERQYEYSIRGIKGKKIVFKDNLGRIQEIVNEQKPIIGARVTLTLDIEIQKYVETLLGPHTGTIAIADLSSGGIVALVSKPNFNPEKFSDILDPEEWRRLVENPDRPLHNKFTQGLYSPGSIFKIVMALAGLQEKIITPATRVNCGGLMYIYNRYFHCWRSGGHGWVDLTRALKESCNIYFYTLGKKLDIDTIAKYSRMLGLGGKTQIDLPNEKEGLIPNRAWKQNTYDQPWFPGETISVSIGGGMITVTPVQILSLIGTVALRGQKPQLHLLERIERNGETVRKFETVSKEIPIEKSHFDVVIKGLFDVVNDEGTGRAARIAGLDVCGKTGTQQIISKENPNYLKLVKQKRFKPHSWFASFAPRSTPRYAIVVFIEHGGDAGQIAAPLAGKIYRKLFKQ